MDISKYTTDMIPENYDSLVRHIQSVGKALRQDAHVVINRNVTTRAWLTGYYIVKYEQHGSDRANYGERLLQNLSQSLGGKSYSVTNLRSYRLFYSLYPELRSIIGGYILERFGHGKGMSDEIEFLPSPIQQSLIAELQDDGKQQSVTAESASSQRMPAITAISRDGFAMRLPGIQ